MATTWRLVAGEAHRFTGQLACSAHKSIVLVVSVRLKRSKSHNSHFTGCVGKVF